MNATQSNVSDDEIAKRAYQIWEARGCPPGDGAEDWQAAKAELAAYRIGRNGSTQRRLQTWWQRMRENLVGRGG